MHSITEIINDISQGKMVVMLDDEDRENEGDLIMAASMVRPEDINFMASHARGLICLSLEKERCAQLNLPLMVASNQSRFHTNFTLSIEAAAGVSTGISAYDRAHTIRTAVKPNAVPQDITQPGHVFPLMAQPGGVLTRAGHTEAGCDLAKLANLEPAAVLVEILSTDGSMARKPELEKFAKKHQLKIGTIADLIQYRSINERTINLLKTKNVHTRYGDFVLKIYQDTISHALHLALIRNNNDNNRIPLVRVHIKHILSDLVGMENQALGMPLDIAMQQIARDDYGVVLILGYEEDNATILDQLEIIDNNCMIEPHDQTIAQGELKTHGIGAQILRDLGIKQMKLLSAPKRFSGLSGFGLEIVEYVSPVGQNNITRAIL